VPSQTPAAISRTARILHLAMLGSVALYLVVALLALPTPPGGLKLVPRAIDPLTVILLLVAAGDVILARLAPALLLLEARLRTLMADAGTAAPDPTQAGPQALSAGLAAALQAFVVRLALVEAIALLGLVLAFQRRDPNAIVPFVAIAAVGMLISRLESRKVEELARALCLERGWLLPRPASEPGSPSR
jgi:hypothetical protein